LVRFPAEVEASTMCQEIACNVDFAPTFLDFAELPNSYLHARGQSSPAFKSIRYRELAESRLSSILDA